MRGIHLLGARGRLGAALARAWQARAFGRSDVDVSDLDQLAEFLRAQSFQVLVNCTGLTSLEACEEQPELARVVNARAPEVMAREADRAGARLIHFSTDYVFDGELGRLYREDDVPRPVSVYGRSKLEGEDRVLAVNLRHLVVRVSWVFGPDKPSFVDMMLGRALTGQRLEAVADKTSCPTFTGDVAGWLAPWLESDLPGGLLHACNSGVCSWREFAQRAVEIAEELGWAPAAREVRPLAMKDMKTFRAVRPPHTGMACGRLADVLGCAPRPWPDALREYLGSRSAEEFRNPNRG